MIKKFFAAMILTAMIIFGQGITAQARPYIEYQVQVEDYGWMNPVGNGEIAGTTGRAKRLEALRIDFDGDIMYTSHVQNIGWQDWSYAGDVTGTVGRGLRMEAVRIKLIGYSAEHFDIYYRVHVEQGGWLGWAKNGEPAGTVGAGLRMEALQIRLVEKGHHMRREGRPFYER